MAEADATHSELSLPSEPYLVDRKLTVEVQKFLRTIFDCFDEHKEQRLDRGGILSVLIFGYPGTDVDRLVKTANTMLRQKLELEFLTYEHLMEINKDGASRPEAFKNMLTNMLESYKQFQKISAFLKALSKTQLPVYKSELEFLMTMRDAKTEAAKGPVLTELDFHGVVEKLKEAKKVVVMAGAGISTSCGIPDFRTPGTGLYDNLQKFDLPTPQSVFELGFFKQNPTAFWELSKEIYPENFFPSPTHYFISLLAKKGILARHYTQNIDGLERLAGVPDDLLVEAHGTYHSGHCLECGNGFDQRNVKEFIFQHGTPKCPACQGLVKPDITFFGEGLPKRFAATLPEDFGDCDLLLVVGTSLVVAPFCTLKDKVGDQCPRVLINMTPAGETDGEGALGLETYLHQFADQLKDYPAEWEAYQKIFIKRISSQYVSSGFVFHPDSKAYRDVFLQGKCDETVRELCVALGWADELDELINTNNEKLRKNAAKSN